MHTLSECPTAESLQRLLMGFGDDAFADELEQHVGSCPMCAERAKQLPAEDEMVRAVKQAKSADDTPLPAAVQTLVTVLRRLQAKSNAGTTQSWSVKDAGEMPTVSIASPKAFLAHSAEPGEIGRFGPYAVHEVLGTGGMGVVYRGFDSRLQRAVAVKVIRPELLKAKEITERFLAEARAIAAVEHDHIVVVHAVEIHEGAPSLIMPLLKGDTLERQLKDAAKPLPLPELLRMAREIASGLGAAHARGLIHRDIKPANIWVEQPGGRIKILDFGLAVVADAEAAGIAGTPGYMAPEQIRGEAVDARADLFSLGCVLYRAATGSPPFAGTSIGGILVRTQTQEPIPIATLNSQVTPQLAKVIERLLAKNPSDRPESAEVVVTEIDAISAGIAAKRARISRRRWMLGIAATGVVSGLAVWLLGASDPVKVQVEVPTPEAPPVRISFVVDPEIGQIIFTRGGMEQVIDLKSDNAVSLVPGDYSLRSAAETETRKLMPPVVTVLPDTPKTVSLALVGEVSSTKAHDGAVTGVATVPGKDKDRFTVLSAGLDRRVQSWAPGTTQIKTELLSSPAHCFAASADGDVVVTAGGNKSEPFELGVQLWAGATLQPLGKPLEGPKRQIKSVAISADGKSLISAGRDELFLWDVPERRYRELGGHEKELVTAAAFEATGKFAVTGDEAGYLVLWDVARARLLKRILAKPVGSVGAVRAISASRLGFVSATDDGVIRIWDAELSKVRELPVQPKPVRALAVSKDGKRLLSGTEDGSVKLWSFEHGTLVHSFAGPAKAVRSVAFSPNGREAVSGGEDNVIRVWRLPFE